MCRLARLKLFTALVVVLAAFTAAPVAAQPATPTARGAVVVPGRYIVVLRETAGDPGAAAADLGRQHGFQADYVYRHAVRGFAGVIPAQRLALIQADPRVLYVQADRPVEAIGQPKPDPAGRPQPAPPAEKLPTGVDRIDADQNANKGQGVRVAVIDTGIDLDHPDLAANVSSQGRSCVVSASIPNDDHGHGSHVAGTIAGVDNTIGVVGVAPQATLHAVKVLDRRGSGTWSGVICGIDWVTGTRADGDPGNDIQVANMSLGGGGSDTGNCGRTPGAEDALHDAICRSVAAGVTYVVAAGNDGADATTFVPAAYPEVITVSALGDTNGEPGGGGPATSYGGPDDGFVWWSNFGRAVDIAGPGVDIYSTYKDGKYATMSRTSMASPHVAGAAALYLKSNPTADTAQVRTALRQTGECPGDGSRMAFDENQGDSWTCATPWPEQNDPQPPRHYEPLVHASGL